MHLSPRNAISPNSVVLLFFLACISGCATSVPPHEVFTPPDKTLAQVDADTAQTTTDAASMTDTATALQEFEARREVQRLAELQRQQQIIPRKFKSKARKAAKKRSKPSDSGGNVALAGGTDTPATRLELEQLAELSALQVTELAALQDATMVNVEPEMELTAAEAVPEPAALVKEGSAVYYVPKQMTELQTSTVTLWIDAQTTLEQLVSDFASTLNLEAATVVAHRLAVSPDYAGAVIDRSGEIASTRLLVTDIMHAELSGGPEFSISPQGKIKQSLSYTGRAKWPWQVTPNRAADSAELRINIWIDPTGTGTLTESYSSVIQVQPKPQSWLNKLYQWLSEINAWLALLGIGSVGAFVKFVQQRMLKKAQTDN